MSEKKKEEMSLAEALVAIQGRLKAPKSRYNKFGKFNYRSCEDILEAVKPLLHEYGVLMYISDKILQFDGRYYIEATVTLIRGGGIITVTGQAREGDNKSGMDASQITGTASSYARKYALNGLFLIDDTKDADTDEFKRMNEAPAEKQATTKQPATKPAATIFVDDTEAELKAEQDALNCQSSLELTALWNKYKATNPAYCKTGSIFYMAVQKRGGELRKEGK